MAFGYSPLVASLIKSSVFTVGCWGDSLSAQLMGSQYPSSDSGVSSKATTVPFFGGNMFPLAARLAGVRFTRGAGIGGQTSAQILARGVTDIISSNGGGKNQYLPAPKACSLLAGTNDDITVTSQVTITMNNIRSGWMMLIAAGILPIACTLPPRSDNGASGWPSYGSAGTYANRIIFNAALNAEIRKEAILLGIPLYDIDAVLNNGAGGYIGAVTVYSNDGVHPNAAGYWLVAQSIYPVLSRIAAQLAPLSSDDTDPFIVAGQNNVMQLKGGVLVTTSTAGQPDGYGTSHSPGATTWTPTFTTEPTDGTYAKGNWSKLSIAASSGQVTSLIDYISYSEITYNAASWVPTPGQRMGFYTRVATSGLVAGNCNWSVYLIGNQSFNSQSIGSLTVSGANQMTLDCPVATYPGGMIVGGEFIVPPNTTSYNMSVRLQPNATATAMSGNIQIAQPTFLSLDALEIS